jgi:hypothetical protein
MDRGRDVQGEEIHALVTKRLIEKLEAEEVDPRTIDLAIKFLKDNGVTRFLGAEKPEAGELAEELGGPHLPDPSEWEQRETA